MSVAPDGRPFRSPARSLFDRDQDEAILRFAYVGSGLYPGIRRSLADDGQLRTAGDAALDEFLLDFERARQGELVARFRRVATAGDRDGRGLGDFPSGVADDLLRGRAQVGFLP